MRSRAFTLALTVLALLLPATAGSASEWEPEREYHAIAVAPGDDVRYGGYTEDGRGYIDVLDRSGNVIETIEPPIAAGSNSRLYDIDTSGDLLIVSYAGGYSGMLALYRDADLVGWGQWCCGVHPYLSTSQVALTDQWAYVDELDTGIPVSIEGFRLESIPPGGPNIASGASIPGVYMFADDYRIAATEDELLMFSDAYEETSVIIFSSPPGSEALETVALQYPGHDFAMRDASDGFAGSFVMSGSTDPSIESCSIWTYGADGSLQDCFLPKLGGAGTDPFAVDGCGGIVVADVEAEDGVLTGHKLIPSDRDPGCFVDSLGSTFVSNIAAVGRAGITRGCNPPDNDRYCPDDLVTRGQMAALLHRARGDVLTPTRSVEFTDDDDSLFEPDIEWLGGVGVTRGCNPPVNDRYCPDDHVTRGQMAAFLVRALGYTDDGGGDLFDDDDDSIFELDIDKLATAGVTRGCNPPANDRFCPDEFVTRGQMAAFLDRALELQE